jgi:thiol-disulfide isomerase/thioredoxin
MLLALAFGACHACSSSRPPDSSGPIAEGETAPNFRFKDQSGKDLSLFDFRGKVVLINFWATWCPPCREELPSLVSLLRQTDPNQLKILALSVDESWAPVKEYLRQVGMSFPVYDDFDRNISTRYGTLKFPETYIVDRKGTVVRKVIGATDWVAPTMMAYLKELLAEGSSS